MEEFVTISGARKILGVHEQTVRNWERAGRIKAYRTDGGHRRFLRSDIERFCEEMKDRNRKEVQHHRNQFEAVSQRVRELLATDKVEVYVVFSILNEAQPIRSVKVSPDLFSAGGDMLPAYIASMVRAQEGKPPEKAK